MLVLAIIAYSMPTLTGRKLYDHWLSGYAFWASNIGMVAMTLALAVAGVSQVVLERRAGMDFLMVQEELHPHFFGMILAATLFASGILSYMYIFVRYGLPNMEQLGKTTYEEEAAWREGGRTEDGAAPEPSPSTA
jgi:nitric oxide reductase subunit B